MAKKQQKPNRRNMVVVVHIARSGVGAGYHKNKRRAVQVPRKSKHKDRHRPSLFSRGSSSMVELLASTQMTGVRFS